MQIKQNKDFEKEYPSPGIKGFDLRQSLAIFLALAVMGGLGYLLWLHTNLRPENIVYAVFPVGGIIIFALCFRYQGELSLLALIKAMIWGRKTRLLLYSADEYDVKSTEKFSMTRNEKAMKKRRRKIK